MNAREELALRWGDNAATEVLRIAAWNAAERARSEALGLGTPTLTLPPDGWGGTK
jgi:hypothetical protein